MCENAAELSPQRLHEMLRTMYRIRAFEEKVDELFMRGEVHGTTHNCCRSVSRAKQR